MKYCSLLLLLLPTLVSAQIRIVSQERLDSVRNPQVIASKLHFPQEPIRMGSIPEQGGLWTTHFVWENRGEQTPVVITAIKSTCGCLRTEYSAEPRKLGERGSIKLLYNPKGRPGAVDQRLFVYTSLSSSRPTAIVRLVGHVEAAADRRDDYPYSCGSLRLRQQEPLYEGVGEVRIACMNVGQTPLRITEDPHFTPRGVRIFTEPAELQPAQEGDLVIRLQQEPDFREDGSLPLLLRGLDLPPRMRTLKLVRSGR